MEEAVACWRAGNPGDGLQAALCGVTPDIAEMGWPRGTAIVAVDQSASVIQAVWPGDVPDARWAVCADWLWLPWPDRSCEVVIGDGSFNCMDYPDGYLALTASLRRVLKDRGLLIMRCWVQPAEREESAQVFADLHAANIPTFHVFKWRLAMAMQQDSRRGVVMNDIYRAWIAAGVHRRELAEKMGWQEAAIDTINLYEGKQTRLWFPTLAELGAVLSQHFEEVSVHLPNYALGERCPILVRRPREGP